MSETAIEESPDYKQVKQRIKQANVNMMQSTKFYQGIHGFDDSFEVETDNRKTSIFVIGLLTLLAVWAVIGAYHYYDALYSVLALGSI